MHFLVLGLSFCNILFIVVVLVVFFFSHFQYILLSVHLVLVDVCDHDRYILPLTGSLLFYAKINWHIHLLQ